VCIYIHINIIAYATRLEEILDRKDELVVTLRLKLAQFRQRMLEEENAFGK
jgi:hypothetical protein